MPLGRQYPHVFAFRTKSPQAHMIQALKATFPENDVSHAMRWLLGQPEVISVIRRQIADATNPTPELQLEPDYPRFGMDASLPVGDR